VLRSTLDEPIDHGIGCHHTDTEQVETLAGFMAAIAEASWSILRS
jgi:hypothetical protein